MKENRSLELSIAIKETLQKDLSKPFYQYFPFDKVDGLTNPNSRERVFSDATTLLSMINANVISDKSLQNTVNIFETVHKQNAERIEKMEQECQKSELSSAKRGRGRPRSTFIKVPKSRRKIISRNTSAYSQARTRLSPQIVEAVFQDSCQELSPQKVCKFKDREVYIADGTYVQLQDTKEIKAVYNNSTKEGYPRGLLSVIIQQGTGMISDFRISSDKISEIELLAEMVKKMKPKSLLMADDLYNCFALFALLEEHQIDAIFPGKRERNYRVINKISEGDEIVEISGSGSQSKMYRKLGTKKGTIRLRRLETDNPNKEDEKIVLYTTLLDQSIGKEEIFMKYLSRWDIEISIREIKTILGLNIIRSKTPEMIMKEVTSGLIAYNYIRKIISESVDGSAFSPEGDIFQKCYEADRPMYIDKLGRAYSKWSPGRYGNAHKENIAAQDSI